MNTFPIIAQHIFGAFFPGFGHLVLKRPVRAAWFVILYYLAIDGFLFSILYGHMFFAEGLRTAAMATGIFVWISAQVDLCRVRHLMKYSTQKKFVRGIQAYLTGELDEAERIMKEFLTANPSDLEARMYLSLVYTEKGWTSAARRQLKKCRAMDKEGVLDWETKTELERLAGHTKQTV